MVRMYIPIAKVFIKQVIDLSRCDIAASFFMHLNQFDCECIIGYSSRATARVANDIFMSPTSRCSISAHESSVAPVVTTS